MKVAGNDYSWQPALIITDKSAANLAGAPGFEPGDGGIKIRCLTTWLRPNTLANPGRDRAADHTEAGSPDQRCPPLALPQTYSRSGRRIPWSTCISPKW